MSSQEPAVRETQREKNEDEILLQFVNEVYFTTRFKIGGIKQSC